jgi:hypothetical protein
MRRWASLDEFKSPESYYRLSDYRYNYRFAKYPAKASRFTVKMFMSAIDL